MLDASPKPWGLDRSAIADAARACVPDFAFKEDLHVESLKGGLTNLLWVVRPKEDVEDSFKIKRAKSHTGLIRSVSSSNAAAEPVIALVREYGRNTESFMNRKQEEKVVQALAKQGLCPTVFGTFPWGRVEKFLPNSRTPTPDEFCSPSFATRVGELLGRFHAHSKTLLPMCTTPGDGSKLPARLYQYLELAQQVDFDKKEFPRKRSKLKALDVPSMRAEVDWLLSTIDRCNSPVVMAHCDVQKGNLLVYNHEIHMIDFEYADRMERGFDFGNLFCEYGIDYNVTRFPGFVVSPDLYPDEEKQSLFFEAYARGADLELTSEMLDQLLKEARVFSLASHLHWAIWSVVQAGSSTIDWGYLEYAEQRMDQYYYYKSMVNC